MTEPVVSICCLTYNHEKYIESCLEGFLLQKCDFNYEIIIHDDASFDRTQSIIETYKQKHPGVIHTIYQSENQYSKGLRGFYPRFVFPHARGKYIALCEGDDYWTDPLKLQKQVNFLEKNHQYMISYHKSNQLDELGNFNPFINITARDLSVDEIFMGYSIPTATVVFRNLKKEYPIPNTGITSADTFLYCYLADISGLGAHFDISIRPAIYRFHNGGIWSTKSLAYKYKTSLISWVGIYDYFGQRRKPIKHRFYNMSLEAKNLLVWSDYISFMYSLITKLIVRREFGAVMLLLKNFGFKMKVPISQK